MTPEPSLATSAPRARVMLLALAVLIFGAACEPEIGDECKTNLDCPAGAICDTASPGGYCLSRPCDDNRDCASEAVCVAFDRFTTFCMRSCASDDDCRSGYVCREDVGVDRFCYVPATEASSPFGRAP